MPSWTEEMRQQIASVFPLSKVIETVASSLVPYPMLTLNRLELSCNYDRPNLRKRRRKPTVPSPPTIEAPFTPGPSTSSIPLYPVSSRHNSLDSHQPLHPDFDRMVADEVLEIISNATDDMESIIENYFNTVHRWLPILSKSMLKDRIRQLRALESPRAEVACLVLCIYLVIQPYTKVTPGSNEHLSFLYSRAKCVHALVQSSGPVSIELVQAALLLTVYELGHGLLPSAYVSIGCSARLFSAMFLDLKGKGEAGDSTMLWIKEEEERRARWGIIILDRFLNTSFGRELDSFATLSLTEDKYLPTQDSIWDAANESDSPPTALPVSICSNDKVGSFARQAQAAHLLGRVLQHVHEPTSNVEFNKEEGAQLERTLHSLNKILAIEIEDSETDLCGAIGMCNSALLTLITADIEFDEAPCKKSASIKTAVQYVMEHADYMKSHESIVDPRVLTLLVPYSIYQAAILHIKILGFLKTDPRCHYWAGNLYILKTLLVGFGKTWKISDEYLNRVQTAEATLLVGNS
ncbi:hypothetical protein BP6252_13107 [Coleophoma cylindrospora]|uniref:Xylanolytic transcriptional activator regulatory domain-containing protein n=1 Tax=Coleophoma cylindrospora TaxID=1849047 RepID=A0A3D8QA32_9HELO|nr:hypothetical protein BP6252_13107 [Coleophoma cylindrospora]